MAELVTIARPYAEAVYKLAMQNNALQAWDDMLGLASGIASNHDMQSYIDNPQFTPEQKEQLFLSVCSDKINDAGKNFIRVLLENGRVQVLPQIHALFEELKAKQEGTLEAHVVSAFAMSDAQIKDLVGTLEARFKRKIEAHVQVDAALIGGVIVEIGDEVIDASVRGKLHAMALTLKR